MAKKNFKLAKPNLEIKQQQKEKRYKICFKFITADNDFNFRESSLTAKDWRIALDKLRQICSVSKIEFMQLTRADGLEFLERLTFKYNIFDELDKIQRHSDDTMFISIRYGKKGRWIFKNCNIANEDDILHLLAIDPNHKLY